MPFSQIVLGGGALNTQYNADQLDDVANVLQHAFDNGITSIDTAAFYGPSETLIGEALAKLKVDRSKIQVCSKCCRWEDGRFDYSTECVNASVERSLKRLGVGYLDTIYIHDVEFTTPEKALEALTAAFELKKKGLVRNVGISGYPLEVLLTLAKLTKVKLGHPLDAVLSYCNLNLQNNLLLDYEPKLKGEGVKYVLNASPLSMSMLRSGHTHSFHMADAKLLETADQIGEDLHKRGIELADVATQYAIASWDGSTVIGIRTLGEIDAAVKNRDAALRTPNKELWAQIEKDFGQYHNATWEEELGKQHKSFWEDTAKSLN